MDSGLIPGVVPGTWKTFATKMFVAGNSGGLTQPIVDNEGPPFQFARYNIIEKQFCVVEYQYTLVGVATAGAGGSYVWNLPIPAKRLAGDDYVGGSPAGGIVGKGQAYISFAAIDTNIPLVCTLADPFLSLGGDHNSYFQAYAPFVLDWGTDKIAGGVATQTTTHHAGFAFDARDIEVNLLDANTSATTTKPQRVVNITSTTFDFQLNQTAAAGGTNYNYKVRAEPPTGQTGALCSPTVPYDQATKTSPVAGNFMNWFFYLFYPIA